MEKQPVEFLGRKHGELLKKSQKGIADYVGSDPDQLIYVANASTAMNIVPHSLQLSDGDEVLSTNLDYGAMDRMWEIICEQKGAKYVCSKIRLPIIDEHTFVENFWKEINVKTKVIFLSHITSATALLLPIKQLIERSKKHGIITVINGAHVPGQIPLNLDELGCDFYTGNCHKWLMAPKGSAFLYAQKIKQSLLKPFLISWGREEFLSDLAFIDEFEYQGTRDIAAFLSVPTAIYFHKEQINNSVKNDISDLLCYTKNNMERILKTVPIVNNIAEGMQMYAHPLPEHVDGKKLKLKLKLYNDYHIEIPVNKQNNVEYIRISIQIYNNKKEIDYLLNALKELIT